MSFSHWVRQSLVLAALVLAPLAGAVSADSQIQTVAISGGTLSIALSSISINSVTLNGIDQIDPYTINSVVTDATGSGTGWNITMVETPFQTVTGHTLPLNSTLTLSEAGTCHTGSTCAAASNVVAGYPLGIPAGPANSLPTAAKVFNAAANTGMGTIDLTSGMQLGIPAETYAGTYVSTIYVAVVSGP